MRKVLGPSKVWPTAVFFHVLIAGLPFPSTASDCKTLLIQARNLEGILSPRTSVPYAEVPVGPESLLAAHWAGHLPWLKTWDQPEQRGVVDLSRVRLGSDARHAIRQAMRMNMKITFNQSPEGVIRGCAGMSRPKQSPRWMSDDVVEGYINLSKIGFVYSVELWSKSGELVAGNFGIASGFHVQGVSKFRSSHEFSDGLGHVVDAAEQLYFWSRGLKLFDVEVVELTGKDPKKGVVKLPWADFQKQQKGEGVATSEVSHFFQNVVEGQPLPQIQSTLFEVFSEMEVRNSWAFSELRNFR